MPRPRSVLQSDCPYHVTARSINREWFKLPMDEVWQIMSDQLCWISWAYEAKIHSFVLMPNHFHLIVSTPKANLSQIMWSFMRETTRRLNERNKRINQAYGSRHFRGLLGTYQYFLHAYKYIYLNPVVAGLSSRCETYRFSSLNFKLGLSKVCFPIVEDTVLFDSLDGCLKWLNTRPSKKQWDDVSNALKKSNFQLAKQRQTNKRNFLESNML